VEEALACKICLTLKIDTRLNCGHMLCSACAPLVNECPFCRKPVTERLHTFL
jgi:E3 ubiquitin-protein ligase RGLG